MIVKRVLLFLLLVLWELLEITGEVLLSEEILKVL